MSAVTRPGNRANECRSPSLARRWRDLTPVKNGTGPARLLDMVEGRSKKVFKAWLAARPSAWRDRVETVAMDGFTEFKTAAAEEVPHAATVMDPFHVVKLASLALDTCSQRIQQATLGHRGRRGGPLYQARRTLLTGAEFLTQRQTQRLEALFADDQHRDVHHVWGISTRGSSAPTGTPTRPPGNGA